MNEEEIRRYISLRKIFHETRFGVVDGVTFDLRHSDLDPAQWGMHMLSDGYRPQWIGLRMTSGCNPNLWFPWEGVFDWNDIPPRIADDKILRKAWVPEAFVEEGSRIELYKIEIVHIGYAYQPLHDREMRRAFIQIVNKDGTIERLNRPIEFWGLTSLKYRGDIFEIVAARMFDHLKIASLEDRRAKSILRKEAQTWAEAAFFQFAFLYRQKGDAIRLAQTLDFKSPEQTDAWLDYLAIQKAMAVGYYWAKAEAELNIEPLALATLDRKQNARKAGRNSGEARRQKAAAEWQDQALSLAKSVRAKEPALSQNKLAERIAAVDGMPGYDTIKAYLSVSEKSGALTKLPKPSPKRQG